MLNLARTLGGHWAAVCCLFLLCCGGPWRSGAVEDIAMGFLRPPDSAKPWVYWFWLDGNVSREGITTDLEAMQRVGLGGALLMDITQDVPPGPVRFGSPEWRALFQHSAHEARRLGLDLILHNAAGWTGSGGPWIPPDLAMQKLVWGRTNLIGPTRFRGSVPIAPPAVGSNYDVGTLAWPSLLGEGGSISDFAPRLTSSAGAMLQPARLLDRDLATFVTLPTPASRTPQHLQLEFAEPFAASQLKLTGADHPQTFQGLLQVSDNGRTFRTVREFRTAGPNLALAFESLSARYFRILFTGADADRRELRFSELELAPRFEIYAAQAKSGLGTTPPAIQPGEPARRIPPAAIIPLTNIIDLCSQTDPQGQLEWNVPPGPWTIARFAYQPTGRSNHPAVLGGLGLECDKLSREAMDLHFNAFLGGLLKEAGPAAKAIVGTHIDSWEVGHQNWTRRFREEFRQRRGYDPLPYLPAVSGRIVARPDLSERFLWDMRRTVADLVADNYAGRLAELSRGQGLLLSMESYDNGPFDDLQCASRVDLPMGEFWLDDTDFSQFNLKLMPSAAHTWGKPIVGAEAFTAYPSFAKWLNHPFSLKPLADAAFCDGINRLVFHRFAHQPWANRRPGVCMGMLGVHYEGTQTWWEQSRPWHEYLARCQFLLQQGRFVADLCFLTPEGAFVKAPKASLTPPVGYDYDLASPEVILDRMSVQDGRLVLPDGLSYRVLVLPPGDTMTPKLLGRIRDLVADGATVLGAPPAHSPSLAGYPGCDEEVQRLARELWGPCDGQTVTEHPVGRGRIFWGKPLGELLSSLGLPPDFVQFPSPAGSAGYPLRYIHRRSGDTDFYFVANPNPRPNRAPPLASAPPTGAVAAECRFRISGKQPKFWRPDTGLIERPAVWQEHGDQTIVPLAFEPGGSMFVVFRPQAPATDHGLTLTRNGLPDGSAQVRLQPDGRFQLTASKPGIYELKTASGKTLKTEIDTLPRPIELAGPWDLEFPPGQGAPPRVTLPRLVSWSEHADIGVRYFSGLATYRKTIDVPAEFTAPGRQVLLNLGHVCVMAQVKANGKDLGVLWKPPFETDLAGILTAGANELEIRVVNLWPNRLIGDEQLPEDSRWKNLDNPVGGPLREWPQWFLEGKPSPTGRLTFTTWKHWHQDSALLESGLIGPVTLRVRSQRIMQ